MYTVGKEREPSCKVLLSKTHFSRTPSQVKVEDNYDCPTCFHSPGFVGRWKYSQSALLSQVTYIISSNLHSSLIIMWSYYPHFIGQELYSRHYPREGHLSQPSFIKSKQTTIKLNLQTIMLIWDRYLLKVLQFGKGRGILKWKKKHVNAYSSNVYSTYYVHCVV